MNELTSSGGRPDDLSSSVAGDSADALIGKKKRLGALKNERGEFDSAIRMNAEQIINLSDDSRTDEGSSRREESGPNYHLSGRTAGCQTKDGRPEGASDAEATSAANDGNFEQRTNPTANEQENPTKSKSSGEARFCLPNQPSDHWPVASEFMNANGNRNSNGNSNTVCYHCNRCNCSQQFSESANYYLNRQQRFNHLDCPSDRVVSASSFWTEQTTSHSEQKRFAGVFLIIYILFLITWVPFALTIITARLFTWSANEAVATTTNRTEYAFTGFGPTAIATNSSVELDRSEAISDSPLELIDGNLSQTNRGGTAREGSSTAIPSAINGNRADRTRQESETMLRKIRELDFKFINRLWFATLLYSAFSAYFFPIINRRWLANFVQRTAKEKLDKFVHLISNH